MQSISVGRYNADPEAQGLIKPEDGSWQLVIDRDGYPHLYVQVNVTHEGTLKRGLLCIDDMLPEGLSIRGLMSEGEFGGELTPEEEARAVEEYNRTRAESGIPCPR